MYCTKCGTENRFGDYFCGRCGAPTGNAPTGAPEQLYRTIHDKKIAGVCGGLARYFWMDPTIVRILWLLLTFGLPPAGIIGYIAAWILMPPEPTPVYGPAPGPPQTAQPAA
jgi:phage shock protein PspC (stress-responsive transcriptional regulator)